MVGELCKIIMMMMIITIKKLQTNKQKENVFLLLCQASPIYACSKSMCKKLMFLVLDMFSNFLEAQGGEIRYKILTVLFI